LQSYKIFFFKEQSYKILVFTFKLHNCSC